MRIELKIFLTIFLIYIFFISNYGGNWMANSMLSQTKAIVDKGSLIIDDYVKEGCKQNYGCDHTFYEGHFYSGYPPGTSILAIPIYIIFKPIFKLLIPDSLFGLSNIRLEIISLNIIANIFVSMFLSALLAVLLYKFLEYFIYNKKYRLWITFIFAFGTLFFIYSTGFYSRVIASFFNFLSFYLLFKMKKEGIKNSFLFFAGLSSGFSVIIEYTQIFFLGLLGLYMLSFIRNKKILFFILGAVIPLILLPINSYLVYGNLFTTNYHHHNYDHPYYRSGDSEYISRGSITKNIYYPSWNSIWRTLVGANNSIFWYTPILILSLYGLYFGFKKRIYFYEMMFILLVFLTYFLLNASIQLGGWHGVYFFGTRYIIPIIPFMMIPLAFIIRKFFRLVVGFGIISILVNCLPIFYGTRIEWTLGWVEPTSNIFNRYFPLIFTRGLSNYTLNIIKYSIYDIPIWLVNLLFLIGAVILGLVVYLIWRNKIKQKI